MDRPKTTPFATQSSQRYQRSSAWFERELESLRDASEVLAAYVSIWLLRLECAVLRLIIGKSQRASSRSGAN
jgi:hypothetical protein